ncbi:fibrocystin [Hemicordylus capensis]|uniref:fibrocystin n=1 Tax=Hemicordylus capensis TaxID=884348 RepID=UPI002303A96D|nr:fibrocystin [Hemicordylus capensis]
MDFIDAPIILEAEKDGWITICSLASKQMHSIYPIQTEHGLGTVKCRVEGNYIGSHNVSFSMSNKGKSVVHKDAWLISAKQDLFLYQTFPEIFSVSPASGSLGGGTHLTISGDFFDTPVQVTVAGIPCQIKHVSPQKIICTTGAAGKRRRLSGPQPGNRGLLFEVWDGIDGNLTEAAPGYRWQFVPNASSPLGWLSGRQQLLSARLRGFFVAPQTNNYTFWIQADGKASLYLSLSGDPRNKMEVASNLEGISAWPEHWEEENWSQPWKPKSEKFEFTGGAMYYLEAVYNGKSPSGSMKVGVQIHNTWLNPKVVNTYRREKHKIHASAVRLPEIQMLIVSGTGWFSLAWDNVTTNLMSTNITAEKIQRELEELLSVKCETKPSSAKILLRAGFEKDTENLTAGGHVISWTEPFCGRFSAHRLESLLKMPDSAPAYDVTDYTHLCFAHKGYLSDTFCVLVSYSNIFLNTVKKNLTCQWHLNRTNPERWKFTCIDLWKNCLENSGFLKDLRKNSSVFLHQINVEPLISETETSGNFFIDEIIVLDRDIVVFQREPRPARPHGSLIESVSVVGAPPVYNVSFLMANCCKDLPLVSLRGALPLEGSEGDKKLLMTLGEANINLTVQRLQAASPPLGGTFRIHLPNVVISDIPVSSSAHHLRKLLQNHTDNFTAQYLNARDFLVTKDSSSCYQSVWTLTWTSMIGDLPNIIGVSAGNLSGLNPAITTHVIFDGGVFISPIFGDMLATPNNFTQVVVAVNDITANCSGSCTFQYLWELTPLVNNIDYSTDGTVHVILIMGSGLSADRRLLLIEVNQTVCEVLTSNYTGAVCQINLLPVGLYRVTLLVSPYGFATNASGNGDIFLKIMPRLTSIQPSIASEIGGLPVTLTGSGLDGVSLVLFGSQPCPVNASRSNATKIECILPPRRGEDYTVHLVLIDEHEPTVFANAFIYDPSLNPHIVSLSRNRSSTAGGQMLYIGISSLTDYFGLDVRVKIQDSMVEVKAQTDHEISVVLPSLMNGLYSLSVIVNNVQLDTRGVEPLIQYVMDIFKIEPCCGSLQGGTMLTISGAGFGSNPDVVSVLVGLQPCTVTHLNEEKILCQTPPAPQQFNGTLEDFPAHVEVFIGNRSSVDTSALSVSKKNFTFLYKTSLTPNIIDIAAEMLNDSLWLGIEGINVMDSVAVLGDVDCQLEAENTNHSTISTQCSFPLSTLEPGQYLISILQRQVGYANIPAAMQHLTVVPAIKSIFPSHGSACGGQLLTISGLAFKSQTNSAWVNLKGDFSCEIQRSNGSIIECALSPSGPFVDDQQLRDVPRALNITVTVNGIRSHCLGDCSFHLLENLTLVIDAVTVKLNGTLTHLFIRGQTLAWAVDEVLIKVDRHFPCNVIFSNETDIECQTASLVAGEHSISLLNRKWGQACLKWRGSNIFRVTPQVLQFYPQNFSVNGKGLLTLKGMALKGSNNTSVMIGNNHCLLANSTYWVLQCLVPPGNGTAAVGLDIDDVSYHIGEINYSEEFTPAFISLSLPVNQLLTIRVSRIRRAEDVNIFIGDSPCANVTGNCTTLHCVLPQLPAGEYNVTGGDLLKGWASSSLVFTSALTIVSVNNGSGCLGGGKVHIHGTGFSPENISVTVCGTPCELLDDISTTDLRCLAQPLNASLAVLCGLTCSLEEAEDCKLPGAALIQCDIQIRANANVLTAATPYIYLCDDSMCSSLLTNRTAVNSSSIHFTGLLISPKVERDEVLIYNSSCNITMETEAEMECEGPNQPITAKITEIWKNRGQNTQSTLPLRFCGQWSKNMSWLHGYPPQDGDNVTVERGQTLFVDTSTSILNLLHVKGGKLVFLGPGPVELHAHYILVSDGGELRVGSPDDPFCGTAHIHLHGSSHSPMFFPYGVKFLAVRNGTLAMHGCIPKVTVTYLKLAAEPNDTKLVLVESVDWKPGDEVVVCGGGLGGAEEQEELVIVKTVNGTELYIMSPLRYPHGVSEEEVFGERLAFRAVVAVLSRNVVIQGNFTSERLSHLKQCKEAGISGEFSECLYKRSERKLGSRDMGAVVVVQAYHAEESWLQVEGVQFRHVGQAFQKHLSALTINGNAQMSNSYVKNCVVFNSFARGVSLSGVSELRVENNIFYNIMGHGLRIRDRLNKKNKVRHNTIIGLSGTDGLSSTEISSPAGIYIQDPDNLIEGNTVCAAGNGYFFHLSPIGRSETPILLFTKNVAHSCSRYGLLFYRDYHTQKANSTVPVMIQSFTAWQCQGGVQIISNSNLQLETFHICSCKDFGVDIVESLGNTSVAHSLLIGHFHGQDGSCMLTGLKTPKRHELLISNTTFMNFDINNCTAITTCSDCYQGQGGFTVRTEQVLLLNVPNWISFPFLHSAVLKDLDGSINGQEGSHLLPSMDTLPASCMASVNASHAANGSICFGNITFHRMSIGLKASVCPYTLKVTDSSNKTTIVNYVSDTLSTACGWMTLLLDQETYTLSFEDHLVSDNLQYIATFDNFIAGNYLLVQHEALPSHFNVTVTCGTKQGSLLQSFPSHGHHKSCDWFFSREQKKLTYLVTGRGQIQVTFKAEDTGSLPMPDPIPPPPPVLKWSHSKSWDGVTKGWGGYNETIPSPGEDVIILPGRTILVDASLPSLRGLYILGTLEFPLNSSNVISAACIVIAGGVLKVGSLQHPLESGVKLQIFLRTSEGVYCDRLEGISVYPGTIGVYGKLQMHSAYTRISWTHLGSDAAPGNERVLLQDEVDWHHGDNLVISSSSYEAHQAELVTLEKVNSRSIRIRERLLYRHIGHSHILEDGQQISVAAEIGLLTRNIQIKSDTDCTGRLLVGYFRDASGTQYAGELQLSNVEILNFGSSRFPSVDIRNVTLESFIISSSIHQSCGAGIQAVASGGLLLCENVVFSTIGHGIHLEGQNYSLIRNLVILSKQPETSLYWVAGIKTNVADGAYLHNNIVAGSERIAFHIKGQDCFLAEKICTDNVAHSSLHGVHLYGGDGFSNCTKITGFLSYKNYDYGIMLHHEGNIMVENVLLVDNAVGLLPVLYCPSAELQCQLEKLYIELRNSTLVATSSSFDCIKDRIHPLSADLTVMDRAPRNPWRGRVGMLWPSFTSEPGQWPDNPWHKIRKYSTVPGIMTLQDVTFAGFMKTCYANNRDICIMTNPDDEGILHLVTSERTRMLHVNEQNMFYFYPLQTRKNESRLRSCADMRCGNPRKALFKDMDGTALELDPPVSVFPKSGFEWEQPCLDAGIYREDKKCIFMSSSNVYFCKETGHTMLILETMDTNSSPRKFSPPVLMTDSFIDTFSDAVSQTSCCPSEHSSIFYSILPSNKLSKICFVGPVPWSLRLYLNSGHNATKIILAIFYDEPRSFHVFVKGNFIPPTVSFSKPTVDNTMTGTNYFSFQENLLYVAIHSDESVEIHTYNSLHAAFTIAETTGEEAQAMLIQQLADFLQIGHDQVRTVHNSSGNERSLKAIADNVTKKKHHCLTMKSCLFTRHRAGRQKTITGSIVCDGLQPSCSVKGLRTLIMEISDPPYLPRNKLVSSFSSDRLNSLANTLINAQQIGELQRALEIPVDSLVVLTSATSVPVDKHSRNGSSLTPEGSLYVRPYNISVWIQPSNGVMEKPLPRQPHVGFLDKQGRRILTLGFHSKPWIVTAYLKGNRDAVLKGDTRAEVQDGQASFRNLVISSFCSNCYLTFKVTSPPGAVLSVKSKSFTVYPVAVTEKSALVFTAVLGSIAFVLVLGSVVICWFKKRKRSSKLHKYVENIIEQALKKRKHSQIQANPHILHAHPCNSVRENKHNTPAMREDLKLHRETENTAEPLKKLHQRTFNSPSVGVVKSVKYGDRTHAEKSVWGSVELQQLDIKELNEWKEANQHIFDYAQQKEMKEGQLKQKRHLEKPPTRSGGGVRGKQQIIVV